MVYHLFKNKMSMVFRSKTEQTSSQLKASLARSLGLLRRRLLGPEHRDGPKGAVSGRRSVRQKPPDLLAAPPVGGLMFFNAKASKRHPEVLVILLWDVFLETNMNKASFFGRFLKKYLPS